MFTYPQLLAHMVGDYWLQSDWMASQKTKSIWPALAHVATYTLPFLLLTQSWKALLLIAGIHLVIDHWRLARYLCWAKNWLAPRGSNAPWKDCQATGYGPDKPAWLAVWLLILTDNVMHLICNGLALHYFG